MKSGNLIVVLIQFIALLPCAVGALVCLHLVYLSVAARVKCALIPRSMEAGARATKVNTIYEQTYRNTDMTAQVKSAMMNLGMSFLVSLPLVLLAYFFCQAAIQSLVIGVLYDLAIWNIAALAVRMLVSVLIVMCSAVSYDRIKELAAALRARVGMQFVSIVLMVLAYWLLTL